MNNWAFIIARQIFESEIWELKPIWWLKVWIYIIWMANYKDKKCFKKWDFLTNTVEIYEKCKLESEGIKPRTVENCIKWLKCTGQITTRKTTRGMYITVLNYAKYQDFNNYWNGTKNGTQDGIGTEQARDDKEEGKELKNNSYREELENIILVWNQLKKTDSNFTCTRKINSDLLEAYKKIRINYADFSEFKYDMKYSVDKYFEEIRNRQDDWSGYFNHRFSLFEFIKQKNWFTKFLNK